MLTAAALVAKVLTLLTGKGPARALVKGKHLEDWATSRAGRKRFSMAATIVMRQRNVGGWSTSSGIMALLNRDFWALGCKCCPPCRQWPLSVAASENPMRHHGSPPRTVQRAGGPAASGRQQARHQQGSGGQRRGGRGTLVHRSSERQCAARCRQCARAQPNLVQNLNPLAPQPIPVAAELPCTGALSI